MTQNTKNTTSCNTKDRGRCWALTINNYSENNINTLEALKPKLKDYAWQEEKGKEGTIHLQVALNFINARTFSGIKKLFDKAHIERCKSWIACKAYCCKKDTCTGNLNDVKEEKSPLMMATYDPMDNKIIFDWEQDILDLLKEVPDDRSIYWYYDKEGGIGKTTFVKSLTMKNSDYIYISGKVADIKYGITKYILDNKKAPKAIFMNIPRCVEHISYNGLEQVKDGIFYNTKYESGMVIYDYPHVIVFANEAPDYTKMSKDRWKVTSIGCGPADEDTSSLELADCSHALLAIDEALKGAI